MSDTATALAIPELEALGNPRVTIRIGRQGKTWHAVASIDTAHGPILVHARADQRAIWRGILHNPQLRRWVERISQGAIAPGALDRIAANVGFDFNPFKALSNLKPLAKIVENVAHGKVLRDVSRQVGQVASKLPGTSKAINLGERAARAALGRVVNNPLWDVARTGISFIPGIGTGVSAGMAAAAAFGRGKSAQDIALAAARGALPGGDLAKLAWDVGVGLAKNPKLDASAMKVVQGQLGNLVAERLGGTAGGLVRMATSGALSGAAVPAGAANALDAVQAAFKAGVAVARTQGRPLNPSNASALVQALSSSPVGARIGRIASSAMAQSHYRTRAVTAYQAAMNVIARLERQDPLAFAELQQLQSEAAKGHHNSRVALQVLHATQRLKSQRAAVPMAAASAQSTPTMAKAG